MGKNEGSQNVLNDPQHTIWTVMRPVQGFEDIFQGKSIDTPIQLYPTLPQPLPLENDGRSRNGYRDDLASYLEVPNGATLRMVFPLMQAYTVQGGGVYAENSYTYQLRWRQRISNDNVISESIKRYTLASTRGYDSLDTPPQPRFNIPASSGDVITPAFPAGTNRNLSIRDKAGNVVTDQQGVVFPGIAPSGQENVNGPTFYPPEQRAILGDEVSLVVYRNTGGAIWDFTDRTGEDWPLAYTLGTGRENNDTFPQFPLSHPVNSGSGIFVASVVRSTTP